MSQTEPPSSGRYRRWVKSCPGLGCSCPGGCRRETLNSFSRGPGVTGYRLPKWSKPRFLSDLLTDLAHLPIKVDQRRHVGHTGWRFAIFSLLQSSFLVAKKYRLSNKATMTELCHLCIIPIPCHCTLILSELCPSVSFPSLKVDHGHLEGLECTRISSRSFCQKNMETVSLLYKVVRILPSHGKGRQSTTNQTPVLPLEATRDSEMAKSQDASNAAWLTQIRRLRNGGP